MRKLLLIITILGLCTNAKAQTDEEMWEMGTILSVGYKSAPTSVTNVPFHTFSIGYTEHNYFNNIDFNSTFQYGSRTVNGAKLKYMNIEPLSLVGMIVLRFIMFGGGDPGGEYVVLMSAIFAQSAMSFNINITDNIGIRPYWSLLRMSRLYGDIETYRSLNGAVGTNLTLTLGNFMISPYIEYGFDYGFDYSRWENTHRGVFKGWSYGVSLGVKLWDVSKYR